MCSLCHKILTMDFIKNNKSFNDISKEEVKLIEKISKKWKDKKTSEIVDFTHNQLPFKICSPDEIIPYELITQEDPAYVY